MGGSLPATQPGCARGGDHELDETADTTQQRLRTGWSGPTGRREAGSRESYRARDETAAQDLAWVRARLARQLLARKAPHAEPRRAGHSALYPLQGGGWEGQRRGDTPPGPKHHGPLR